MNINQWDRKWYLNGLSPTFPQPNIFTHATDKGLAILRDGILKTGVSAGTSELEYIPCTLDGTRWYGPTTLIFPLEVAKRRETRPVFYLTTGGLSVALDPKNRFLVMPYTCMIFMEIQIRGDISLNELLYITTEDPSIEEEAKTRGYRVEEKVESPLGSAMDTFAKKQPEIDAMKPPPLWMRDYIHGYNQMVCETFNLDYEEVKRVARDEGEDWQIVWW